MFPADNNSTPTDDLVFAADLGGTHLRAAAVDRKGQIRFRLKRQTPQTDDASVIVDALVDAVSECRSSDDMKGKTISGLLIAVPGTVSFGEGRVVTVPNLPCLENFHLGSILEKRLGCPTLIENDANAAAVGEMWLGAGRGYRNIICVTLGTGVGGGIIIDGELLRGVDGSAGEVGHIGVDPFAGVPCKCGSEGCLEVYASATAIVRMGRDALPAHPESILNGGGELSAKRLYDAATQGDELALMIFNRMGEYLGIGLATLVNLFNPEIIIIGGGVADGWKCFHEPMERSFQRRAFPVPARRVKVTRAECGDDAGLLGAAKLAFASLAG